jgi:hypothetical protein
VLHLYFRFSAASPLPRYLLLLLSAPAGHPPPPPPLLDASVATCCSHLRQLLSACMRVRSGGGTSRDFSIMICEGFLTFPQRRAKRYSIGLLMSLRYPHFG